MNVQVTEHFVDETRQVLARRDPADRAGEDVVEHQSRDGDLGQSRAHRLLDHAVDAAPHEHAAAFHVHLANRVGEEHHRQDEPGRCRPDGLLRDAAGVKSRGSKVIQDNGGRLPEGDKREHGRRGQ